MATKRFIKPFGEDGLRVPIPDSTAGNDVSYEKGYTEQYGFDPVTDPDAKFVELTEENQIFHDITSNLKLWQENVFPDFITAANNDGVAWEYKKGDTVLYNGENYESLENNNTDLPTTEKWVVKKPNDVLRAILIGLGYSGNYGFFEKGFVYREVGDLGFSSDGVAYIYAGVDLLPVTVPSGTDPVASSDYDSVSFNDHSKDINRNEVGAHDDIYIRTVAIEEAIAEDAPVGTRYNINGSNFTVVDILDSASDFYLPLNASKKLKAIKPYSLVGLGILDNGDDMTSEIISLLTQAAGDATVLIKTGGDIAAKWGEVVESMPENIIIDTSGTRTVWRDDSGAYNTKIGLGQLSKDSANNDSLGQIVSGHNTALQLLNTGGAGTSSGDKRLCSFLFSNRILDPEISGRIGYQNTAIVQLGQRTSKDYWTYNIRRLAPWEAAGATFFEFWSEGVLIPAGGYVRSNNQIYKTVSGGTTGSTSPSHTSGSVSDGGVLWDWVSTGDTTIFSVTEDGYISNGGAFNVDDLLSLGMTKDGNAAVNWSAKGISNDVVVRGFPTDAAGIIDLQVPYQRSRSSSKSFFIEGVNGQITEFTKDAVENKKAVLTSETTISNNASTVDVTGISSIILSNTSATSISYFTNGANGQVLELMATNSNTTLVNGSLLRLEGGINLTMNAFDVVRLKKPKTTSAWVEASRSIK